LFTVFTCLSKDHLLSNCFW